VSYVKGPVSVWQGGCDQISIRFSHWPEVVGKETPLIPLKLRSFEASKIAL
jgi:hypothetical protein